ncbi:unnamed protein product, partial [Hymenolepis diminuta]
FINPLLFAGWEWDSEKRPSFQEVYARLESVRTYSDINEAVEHELQRSRIRMPPPPLPPPPSIAPFGPRRSSSCDRIDEAISVPSTEEVPRREHGNSFTTHDVVSRRVPSQHPQYPPAAVQEQCPSCPSSHPTQGCMVPGNRFSEVFSPTTAMFPPPPPPEFDGSGLLEGSTMGMMSGSLGRRKAAPPVPPQRTTTLKGDDPNERIPGPIQISIGDRHRFSPLDEENFPSPPDALLGNTTLSQSSGSPSISMVSSATFVSTPQPANPHRVAIPVPPQRSESTKNQNAVAQIQEGCIAKSSPKRVLPPAQSPPNGLASSSSSGSLDFHAELSSRLKRQLDSSRLVETPTRSPPTPGTSAVTAEMIKASKSKLKATSTPVTETQPPAQPAVPAWKELVVQRRLKNATETPAGKRMSWAPTSNSSLKQNQPTKTTNVEAVSEVAEEYEEKGHEDPEVPAIMSQSVIFPSNSATANQTLNYDALLKQITDLCADLNLATINLPNENNNTLIDRIEGLKKACLRYADELDCSAHAKFRFRDDCAKLQKAADTLRSVCGVGSGKHLAASELGGRRKTFQSVHSTVEAIHQSLLRLGPAVTTSSNDSLEELTNGTTARNGFVSTGVA